MSSGVLAKFSLFLGIAVMLAACGGAPENTVTPVAPQPTVTPVASPAPPTASATATLSPAAPLTIGDLTIADMALAKLGWAYDEASNAIVSASASPDAGLYPVEMRLITTRDGGPAPGLYYINHSGQQVDLINIEAGDDGDITITDAQGNELTHLTQEQKLTLGTAAYEHITDVLLHGSEADKELLTKAYPQLAEFITGQFAESDMVNAVMILPSGLFDKLSALGINKLPDEYAGMSQYATVAQYTDKDGKPYYVVFLLDNQYNPIASSKPIYEDGEVSWVGLTTGYQATAKPTVTAVYPTVEPTKEPAATVEVIEKPVLPQSIIFRSFVDGKKLEEYSASEVEVMYDKELGYWVTKAENGKIVGIYMPYVENRVSNPEFNGKNGTWLQVEDHLITNKGVQAYMIGIPFTREFALHMHTSTNKPEQSDPRLIIALNFNRDKETEGGHFNQKGTDKMNRMAQGKNYYMPVEDVIDIMHEQTDNAKSIIFLRVPETDMVDGKARKSLKSANVIMGQFGFYDDKNNIIVGMVVSYGGISNINPDTYNGYIPTAIMANSFVELIGQNPQTSWIFALILRYNSHTEKVHSLFNGEFQNRVFNN